MTERTFYQLYSEWLAVRAQAGLIDDETLTADARLNDIGDRECQLAHQIKTTPVGMDHELLRKAEVLSFHHATSKWADKRDMLLMGSLLADLRHLDG